MVAGVWASDLPCCDLCDYGDRLELVYDSVLKDIDSEQMRRSPGAARPDHGGFEGRCRDNEE
jgi:hypothetical protein